MKRKEHCWSVLIKERDLFDQTGFDLVAILRVHATGREGAEKRARDWWARHRVTVLPHHAHAQFFFTDVPDVPTIMVSES